MRFWHRLAVGLLAAPILCASLAGCGTLPNANEADSHGVIPADTLRAKLRRASDLANLQEAGGMITDVQGQAYIELVASDLLDSLNADKLEENEAWEYAEICITAHRWKLAEEVLRVALRKPASEDRRVVDTLRLSRVQAELGQAEMAIATSRSVFDTSQTHKAPILLAVYLEIVPAIQRQGVKGREIELARLVEDAISQHQAAVVDDQTDSGRLFLMARVHHIRHAWEMIRTFYQEANRDDLAKEAERKERELDAKPYVEV